MGNTFQMNLAEMYNASNYKIATDKLAQIGWTIPQNMTYMTLIKVSRAPEADVAAYMKEYFTLNNYEKFDDLLRQISNSKIRKDIIEVTEECRAVFGQGHYAVCAMALSAVIEGLLSKYLTDKQDIRMKKLCKEQIETFPEDGHLIDKCVWDSIYRFISDFFQKSDFNASEPDEINRHWLLHGRADYSGINEIDCLRLFNVVGSICVIANHEQA